jgi:arabinogalactan endo-1,4-beta-galactosidase
MILETGYPWSKDGNDNYNNQFGDQTPVNGFPFTPDGQFDFMKRLTTEVKDGGGIGVIYWEPAWITSSAKDLWGTGSSWENCTFFDFQGNTNKAIGYMKITY